MASVAAVGPPPGLGPPKVQAATSNAHEDHALGNQKYSRSRLLRLSQSPLVTVPEGIPPFADWFGWVSRAVLVSSECGRLSDHAHHSPFFAANGKRTLPDPTTTSTIMNDTAIIAVNTRLAWATDTHMCPRTAAARWASSAFTNQPLIPAHRLRQVLVPDI